MKLFPQEVQVVELNPGSLTLWPAFLSEPEAIALFQNLLNNTAWKQEDILLFGKTHKIPRLQAWYGDKGTDYSYSGISLDPIPFSSELLKIKIKIEKLTGVNFNSCLINYYRNGNDGMGWHSDNERQLGEDPVIASLSLGEERKFRLRSISNTKRTIDLVLASGSILVMEKGTQMHWQHSVPKTKRAIGPRINLTFRRVIKKP
jgi:alkylated DNA repair dioxygenase AlkB